METVGEQLGRALWDGGVRRVFGEPIPGLDHVAVPDPALASLLADADGRLGPGPGCALDDRGVVRISTRPGAAAEQGSPRSRADIRDLVEDLRSGAVRLVMGPDLGAPATLGEAPAPARRPTHPPPPPSLTRGAVVLAGPGVVRSGYVDGLQALAAAGNLPVANTWGAKGVLRWDSPHHMGTCGLQARDFELLGFARYDRILAVGVDPDESPPEMLALAPVVELPPEELEPLALVTTPARGPIPPNELYSRLSAIAQPGYVDERVPLHPARAVGDLRAALPTDGIIAADPGVTGLWVARSFPTTEPGSVVVPATVAPGIAAALALVAALRGHPAIAVTTEPLDHATEAVLELASNLDAPFVLEVWGGAAPARRAAEHLEQLGPALAAPGVTIVDVAVDTGLTRLLVEAAGPVVAWGGTLVQSAR